MPDAVDLIGNECLEDAGRRGVSPAGAAVARCGARHRTELRVPAVVERDEPGDCGRCTPGAVDFAGYERVIRSARRRFIIAHDAAFARLSARHRRRLRGAPSVWAEGDAGDLDYVVPGAVHLADHVSPEVLAALAGATGVI